MKITSRLLKESYYLTQVCGLPVAFIPKKGLHKKSAAITTHYGSIDIEFKPLVSGSKWINSPPGVAHFLEHQLFKKRTGNIMQEFSRLGGYYNAATGYTTTSYFFTATDNFKENLELLLRLVFEPCFSEEGVAKEKMIIEQELKMYLDMPDTRLMCNLLENLYHCHPVRLEIGGTVESIKEIDKTVLQQCHRTFYHPNNMIAVFAGDIDRDIIIKQLQKYLSGMHKECDSKGNNRIERKIIEEPPEIRNRKTDIKMAVNRPRILIGYKDNKIGLKEEKLLYQSMITDIMLDCLLGKSSALYSRLYNDGIIDESFSFGYEVHPTYGLTVIGGETDNPDELYDRILSGIQQARKNRIKKRDIERIKRKYLGKFIRLFDSLEHISGLFTYYYFNKLRLFETPHYIKKISTKDILLRLDECLAEKQHAISIIRSRD